MRIHNAELQLKILEKLGFTEERAKAQFGFLMEALTFGAPPMGGFALGLDRVCMLLAGADPSATSWPFQRLLLALILCLALLHLFLMSSSRRFRFKRFQKRHKQTKQSKTVRYVVF